MSEEMRERIRVIIHIQNFDKCSIYAREFSERELAGVRVLPACDADGGSRTLNPVELNEAVQMWMDRPRSIPEDLVTQLHIKDAEIHRLSNALALETRVRGDLSEACGEHEEEIARLTEERDNLKVWCTFAQESDKKYETEIARLKDKCNKAILEPHYPGGPWDRLHKANVENHELKNRIADLENLMVGYRDRITDFEKQIMAQRATIDAQGKARIHLAGLLNKHMPSFEYVYEELSDKKEPELFICPAHGESGPCPTCHHSKPHEHTGENCNFEGTKCKKCIPYKEPAQTPAPEETGLYICPNVGCKTACPYCNGDGKIQYGIDELEFI